MNNIQGPFNWVNPSNDHWVLETAIGKEACDKLQPKWVYPMHEEFPSSGMNVSSSFALRNNYASLVAMRCSQKFGTTSGSGQLLKCNISAEAPFTPGNSPDQLQLLGFGFYKEQFEEYRIDRWIIQYMPLRKFQTTQGTVHICYDPQSRIPANYTQDTLNEMLQMQYHTEYPSRSQESVFFSVKPEYLMSDIDNLTESRRWKGSAENNLDSVGWMTTANQQKPLGCVLLLLDGETADGVNAIANVVVHAVLSFRNRKK